MRQPVVRAAAVELLALATAAAAVAQSGSAAAFADDSFTTSDGVILEGKTQLTAIASSGVPPLYIESITRFIEAYASRRRSLGR